MLRYVKDIGMFAWDRPRSSCRHATTFCRKHCYNNKLEGIFGHVIRPKDKRNEEEWETLTGEDIKQELKHRRKPISRVRGCTRGENFSTHADIYTIYNIVSENPTVLFWLPTRAWRNEHMRESLDRLRQLPNVRVLASIDPSNTPEEIQSLIRDGWSTMYFGDNTKTEGRHKCSKTWNGEKGACEHCQEGCFSSKQVHVHLKQH